ncbi:MAG: TlpA disulfide reductase family protein [Candidatus Binatia bacterium]
MGTKAPDAMKNNLRILFIAAMLGLLFPFWTFAQEQDLWKKLKLVPESGSSQAPNFTSSTLDGGNMGLVDFKGRLVLLNFWATWCPPCRLEMPSMEKLYREFKGQGLEIVAMNFMEKPEPINQFLKENGITFTILLDRTGDISQRYKVHALPVTFLIGREGDLLAKSLGYKDWHTKEVRQFVSLLLRDEEIVTRGLKDEIRAGFWLGGRQGQLLVLGMALLGFLIASSLWVKKAWFREK